MRTIRYRNFTNDTAMFGRGYVPGDTLLAGWTGEINYDTDPLAAAEAIFERHNHPDRPDGQMCPSMSIGDVIVLGEIAVTVERIGFRLCHVEPADIDDSTTWVARHTASH